MHSRGIELWWVLRRVMDVTGALLCGAILYHLTFKDPPAADAKKKRAGWQVVTPIERVGMELWGGDEKVSSSSSRPEARYNHRSVHAPLAGKVFTTFGYRCVWCTLCSIDIYRLCCFNSPYMVFFAFIRAGNWCLSQPFRYALIHHIWCYFGQIAARVHSCG